VALGERRPAVVAAMARAGYRQMPGSVPTELDFRSPTRGQLNVDFFDHRVILLQKYNDPTIKVGGVSIESTLRQAELALPNWHAIRCPNTITLLVSPDGHTYFELPHNLDQGNEQGFNGVAISTPVADRSTC
jgi:hypothetical protein